MKHYYISDPTQSKYVDISEIEFYAIVGDETTRPYASKVYRGEMSIEEVPEDIREAVSSVVQNKIDRWGTYQERDISDTEALNIITGG